MSLTQRLTLLYSLLLGGILLIFGAAVFLLVNTVLLSQVDDGLAGMAREVIIALSSATSLKEVRIGEIPDNLDVNISVQVWGLNDKLQDGFGPLGRSEWALDPANTRTNQPRFREVAYDERLLRVLSVPLGYGGGQIAVMQVAVPLDSIESARTYLSVCVVRDLAVWRDHRRLCPVPHTRTGARAAQVHCRDGGTDQPCG
jgi:hypothetical protein